VLVSAAARRARVQLLHSMANFAPAWGAFKRVVTIHDLQYRAVPERISPPVRALTGALVSLAARRSDRIIAVSRAGAEELQLGLGVDRSRVDVVPNGVRPARTASAATTEEMRRRLALAGRQMVLTVATNLPHKNLSVLIDALALTPQERRPVLALAGHGTDDGRLMERAHAAGVAEHVRPLGRCSAEQLDALYAAARCLALPTLHEGFGLPVIEAMARSLAVACSDLPALREVAGATALYFDPHDPRQIATSLAELLSDDALVRRLVESARERAAQFSWSAAAQGTLSSYRRALELTS
jgi:glycosyltransferase involved in cell wall biosynthesis